MNSTFSSVTEMDSDNYTSMVNNSNSSSDHNPYESRPETYIVPLLFAVIFVVGVLGNGTLIFIFIHEKKMRNIPNTYIFSLAIGDILVILLTVPFVSVIYITDSWPFGDAICKIGEVAKDVSVAVSVFTLTALSADRYFAIVDPLGKHAGRRAKRITLITAIIIWIFAGFCALPAVLFSHVHTFITDKGYFLACIPYPDAIPSYASMFVIAKFVVFYVIPLKIIAVFYILMSHHLILSTQNMPGEVQGQARQIIERRKVAKIVLFFVLLFAICFLPYHVYNIWFFNYPRAQEVYNAYWNAFRIFGFCLSFINSCINPIALYCVSGTFRKHFDRYLFCCCAPMSQTPENRNPCDSSHSLLNYNSTLRRPEEFTLTTYTNGDKSVRRHEEFTPLTPYVDGGKDLGNSITWRP